jgi:hypothetical protein
MVAGRISGVGSILEQLNTGFWNCAWQHISEKDAIFVTIFNVIIRTWRHREIDISLSI